MALIDYFKKKEKLSEDASISEKTESNKLQIALVGNTHGAKVSESYNVFDISRAETFKKNMDRIIDLVKDEKIKRPFLSRTINNITKGALKEGYYFAGEGETDMPEEKLLQVEEKFEDIMYASNYEPRMFIREILSNLVNYSNAFIRPMRGTSSKKNQPLERLLIIQNRGWEVKERVGSIPIKWIFSPDGAGNHKKEYGYKDIWHLSFNKETDEVFGAPIWLPVIPALRKYDTMLEEAMQSYADQGLTKIVYTVGGNSGKGKASYVDPVSFDNIKLTLQNSGYDDVVINGDIQVHEIKKEFKTPEKLTTDIMKLIVSGLHTSESQLGISGAGRQDAETQSDNTNLIVEDFQEALEDWISFYIIREICIDLFGDYTANNRVKFKFKKTFNDQERKEKHDLMMFQGNAIDHDELRNRTGRGKRKFNKENSWLELTKVAEMEKAAEAAKNKAANASNPSNQHKPNGTGTSKKTKKDEEGSN